MTVNYLDLAICIIVVLGIIWGAIRGFSKSIQKSFILVVALSSLLCSVIGNALYTTSAGASLEATLTTSIGNAGGELFSLPLVYDKINDVYYLGTQTLQESLQSVSASPLVKVVMLITPMILKGKTDKIFVDGAKSFLEIVTPVLTKLILVAITFVALVIIFKILFIIIDHLLRALFEKIKIAKWLDKLLGAILMFVKSALFILVGLWIVSFVAGMDFQGVEVLTDQIATSTIGKWLIDNNVLNQLLAKVFGR